MITKLRIILTLLVGLTSILVTAPVLAATPPPATADSASPATPTEMPDTYYRGRVTAITDSGVAEMDGQQQAWQTLRVELLNGDEQGKKITVDNGKSYVVGVFQTYAVGDDVVVVKPFPTPGAKTDFYYITDRYRTNGLIIVSLVFFALAIYFGRMRGFTSIIGLVFSVFILFYGIIPRIIHGADPFWTCLIGACAIMLVSLYLSHGFNRRTSIALVSTFLSLGLAVLIDLLFVHIAHLSGNGAEEAFYLQFSTFTIDLRGLLLGGILIGVLGVLDDVTTGQVAAIEEIHDANPTLGFAQLYRKGISVGREHIASLVNTLVLAYVGASFPLLILYSSRQSQPLWITLNSNFMAEEIVRTLVGSAVLVMAVPLTTLLAASFYARRSHS